MSNEFKDRMLQLLTQVDDLQAKEAALITERARHQDQIALSEAELQRCNEEVEAIRETALGLRRAMDDLKNEIFARPEEETIVLDNAHVATEDGASAESEGQRMWKERQRSLRTV